MLFEFLDKLISEILLQFSVDDNATIPSSVILLYDKSNLLISYIFSFLHSNSKELLSKTLSVD